MYEYKAEVVKVVDGDTIDVKIDLGFSISIQQRLRLARINAPESRTRHPIEKAAGKAATDFLKGFLMVNHNYLIVRTQLDKRGKFGRVLAEVFADGYCVNDLMLEKGHAVPYT